MPSTTWASLSPLSLPPPKLSPQIKNDLTPTQKDTFSFSQVSLTDAPTKLSAAVLICP